MLAGMLTDTPSILGWYVGRNLVHMFLSAVGGTAEGWWPIDQYVNQLSANILTNTNGQDLVNILANT